jgi:hypothetical protein
VVENDYLICADRRLDDFGAFGIVAALHMILIVETPYPRRPPTELRAVLLEREAISVTQVLDLHCMRGKARGLGFAAWRRLSSVGEGSVETRDQKIDLRLDRDSLTGNRRDRQITCSHAQDLAAG